MKSTVFLILFVCFCKVQVNGLSFPGPRVFVVTPSTRPSEKHENKKAPFYYHNWIRRMDAEQNFTTSTTTAAPKVKTPDLIFAEFESDGNMQKSIRKLLEKERLAQSSTMDPIYVSDDEENKVTRVVNYGLPVKLSNPEEASEEFFTEKPTYSFMFNNDYNYNNVPEPVYVPSTMQPTTKILTTTTTTTQSPVDIKNIWHIIDNEKLNQFSGNWQEVPVDENENVDTDDINNDEDVGSDTGNMEDQKDEVTIDENFALPGFATNTGSGAENESRAIRTEPNIRFPYVNLKPFQMKSSQKPLHNSLTNKNNNNMLTSLNHFSDLKHPVRGEAQDIVPAIDRYNPAQPYLPQPSYGNKVSKQSNPMSAPQTATANLVPPPVPPSKAADDVFPAPVSYDSFPPYSPSGPDYSVLPSPSKPSAPDSPQLSDKPNLPEIYVSSDTDDKPTMDMGYRYKPPSAMEDSDNTPMMGYPYKPPAPQYIPSPPPEPKPFEGYSYMKPSMMADIGPMTVADKPEVQGYHYNKPESPSPPMDMPQSFLPPSYGHDDFPPHGHSSEYSDDSDVMGNDMGMMPPPPPPDMPPDMPPDVYSGPPDDHGFPVDFPSDHDFDDHHHYHHKPSTTETPRVNRFSYYYLGKKLYYLPLYFSVYFIVYVGALIIKAVLRHKIVYPNSWKPNTTTATFFSKRSIDNLMSNDNLHEITKKVTEALATAAEKYVNSKDKSA